MTSDLEKLLSPRAIALVGASSDPSKFSGRPLTALRRQGYAGDLYVVNPSFSGNTTDIEVVGSVAELPEGIDLAAVLLPGPAAVDALEAAAAVGIRAAVMFAGGFGETGAAGAALEERLTQVSASGGMRVLGPNTPGFLNAPDGVACGASGFLLSADLRPGEVSIVAQSGAVAGIVASRLAGRRIGLDLVVCPGNEADVTSADVVRHIVDRGRTRVLAVFAEQLDDVLLVEALADARSTGIGVVALVAGTTDAGRDVVASHTGRVAGAGALAGAVCRTLGLVHALDYDDVVEAVQLLGARQRPVQRVAVVGASGGMNALLVDRLSEHGIGLADLAPATVDAVAASTPAFGRATNPVDVSSAVLTDPPALGVIVDALAADEAVDDVIVTVSDHPEPLASAIAEALVPARPIVQWSAGPGAQVAAAILASNGVACFGEPTRCARLVGQLRAPVEASTAAAAAVAGAEDLGSRPSEATVKAFLAANGIAVPAHRVVPGPDGVPAAIAEVGGRAVVKANVRGPAHKSDVGALAIGVGEADGESVASAVLDRALRAWGADAVDGLLVEELVQPAVEILVAGVRRNGIATVTVATGGRLVEVWDDAVTVLASAGRPTIADALHDLRSWPLFVGHRGAPAVDVEPTLSLVERVAALVASPASPVRFLELNPVAVLVGGAVALDAVAEVR